MPHTSYSQLRAAMTCEWRYHLGYVRGVKPIEAARPPELGKAVHAGIQAAFKQYVNDKPIKPNRAIRRYLKEVRESFEPWAETAPEVLEQNDALLKEIEPLAITITEHWARWWDWNRWEPIHIEKPFELRLSEFGLLDLKYVPDLVARDLTDQSVWVIDWKVRESFQPEENEQVNFQKALYQWALLEDGIETTGSAIVQIYPGVPKRPELLKNGKALSRARIRTDWPTYKGAVSLAGFEVSDYLDMREKIELWNCEWFRLTRAFRSQIQLENTYRAVAIPRITRNIAIDKGEITPIRSLGSFHCNHCWARTACMGELDGVQIKDWLEVGAYEERS